MAKSLRELITNPLLIDFLSSNVTDVKLICFLWQATILYKSTLVLESSCQSGNSLSDILIHVRKPYKEI